MAVNDRPARLHHEHRRPGFMQSDGMLKDKNERQGVCYSWLLALSRSCRAENASGSRPVLCSSAVEHQLCSDNDGPVLMASDGWIMWCEH